MARRLTPRGRRGECREPDARCQLSVAMSQHTTALVARCKSRGRMAGVTDPASRACAADRPRGRPGSRRRPLVPAVVDALLDGPRRFGEVRDALPGIAPNILTDRLRRLERERILVSTAYSTRPPRMEYRADRRRPRPGVGASGCSPTGGAGGRAASRSATIAVARRSRPAGSVRRAPSPSSTPRSAAASRPGRSERRVGSRTLYRSSPVVRGGRPSGQSQARRSMG